MPTRYRDPKFPVTIPTDVSVSDIDLDTEPFRAGGQRLTEARAGRIADEPASRSGAGRPSLTAPGKHSPALNLRIPGNTKQRLEEVARQRGVRQSTIVREALDEYLATAV